MDFSLWEPIKQVYLLGSFTILFGHILDFTIDEPTLQYYMQQKSNLYLNGLRSLYFNLLFVSGINYVIAYNFLMDNTTNNLQLVKYCQILLTHNILYFIMHTLVHKINAIRFIHNFHHLFKKNIPSIGNSVSFLEFQIMYVLPFLIAMQVFKPNAFTNNTGIFTISFLNTLIHSSALKKTKWISFLVSPAQHCKHHETYSGTYAAPLLNLDLLTFPPSTTSDT